MKLSEWAKQQGITYRTAWRWWKAGKLPIPAEQMATGTVIVYPPRETPVEVVALYARVSSRDQQADLTRQVGRLSEFATSRGMQVTQTASEIGSGLNGRRPQLLKLLADPKVTTIVVEHRDRLARFGTEYIEAALAASGRKLLVADDAERQDDLVQDIIDVMTSFCARLYGRRSARKRARKAVWVAMEGAKDAGRT